MFSAKQAKALASYIWQGRLSQGLSPLQLAQRAKTRREVIDEIENGEIHPNPDKKFLERLIHKAIVGDYERKKEALAILDEVWPPSVSRQGRKENRRRSYFEIRKEKRKRWEM